MEFKEEPKDNIDDGTTEDAPAVVVDSTDNNITGGDQLNVIILDNNPSKLIYTPY
jgi:hypothetical protein